MSSVQDVFDVDCIIADKFSAGEAFYLVRWKNTITTELQPFLTQYKEEIKNVFAGGSRLFIVWHDSWLPGQALEESCDEVLAAYLVLKLSKACSS